MNDNPHIRRPSRDFRVSNEGPDQLRKIAQAILRAAEGIEQGRLRREEGGLVMAAGPSGNLRVSGDLRLQEVAAGPWDGKVWPKPAEEDPCDGA